MRTSYFPSTDNSLVAWGHNFSEKVMAWYSDLGISLEQAEQFALVQSEFAQAYMDARRPGVRIEANTVRKNEKRDAMKAAARLLVSTINGQASVSNEQRADLGLTVPKQKSKIPVPDVSPTIVVSAVTGHVVKIRVSNFEVLGRQRRPTGVAGANVFCFAGENPPDPKEWKFMGNSSGRDFEIRVDPSIPPGTKIWLTACWYNPRGMNGPAAEPVFTYVQFGGTEVAMSVRKAA